MTGVGDSWDHLTTGLVHISEIGSRNPSYYRTIIGLFERIPEPVLYEDRPDQKDNLVHYTTWKSALEMFKEDQKSEENKKSPVLRMYNYEHSNDPDEGKIKPPEWEDVEKDARASWIDDVLKSRSYWVEDMIHGWSTYGCSFSSGPPGVEDDLTYWRLYGGDGQGCSLKISPPNEQIYRVRYRDKDFSKRTKEDKQEDEQIAKCLKSIFDIGSETVKGAPEEHKPIVGITVAEGLLRIIYGYYHLIKHIAYAGEKEWRMIRVIPRSDSIRFDTKLGNVIKRYVEGPVLKKLLGSASAITIGPTVPNPGAARAYLENLAKEIHEIPYVDVKNSNQTYRQPYDRSDTSARW